MQLPVQNLQSSLNTPVSTVTVAQNINNVQSNYDFLNSNDGAFLGNSRTATWLVWWYECVSVPPSLFEVPFHVVSAGGSLGSLQATITFTSGVLSAMGAWALGCGSLEPRPAVPDAGRQVAHQQPPAVAPTDAPTVSATSLWCSPPDHKFFSWKQLAQYLLGP